MSQDEQRDIIEQLPYLNELMVAIRNINDAILQCKDAREAAENLLSDLPDAWMQDIESKVSMERVIYNRTIEKNNPFLSAGHTPTQKIQAGRNINIAGNDYARNVKRIVVSLLEKKNLLFKTSAKRESNNEYFSIMKGDNNE